MSCEQNQNKAKISATSSGVSALTSKAGNVAGVMAVSLNKTLDRTDQVLDMVGRKIAPVTGVAMNVIGPGNEQTKKAAGTMVGAAAGATAIATAGSHRARKQAVTALAAGGRLATNAAVSLLPQAGTVRLTIKATDAVAGAVGSGLGALSKSGQAGTVMQEKRKLFFFSSKVPVSLWKSKLTPLINKRDVLAVSGKNIVSSRGVMFETGGKTWHQGTTVVKVGGQKRTISHLQSLNVPASHYYFDRPVSNQNTVGIAAGTIWPAQVPGFVGQVSRADSLVPGWAGVKHALIKAHLQWPANK